MTDDRAIIILNYYINHSANRQINVELSQHNISLEKLYINFEKIMSK